MILTPPILTFEAGVIERGLKPQNGYQSMEFSQCDIGTPVFKIRRSRTVKNPNRGVLKLCKVSSILLHLIL
jgi:hypothetical protein